MWQITVSDSINSIPNILLSLARQQFLYLFPMTFSLLSQKAFKRVKWQYVYLRPIEKFFRGSKIIFVFYKKLSNMMAKIFKICVPMVMSSSRETYF